MSFFPEPGNRDAQFLAGMTYEIGCVMDQNYGAATIWYHVAEQLGFTHAQHVLVTDDNAIQRTRGNLQKPHQTSIDSSGPNLPPICVTHIRRRWIDQQIGSTWRSIG